MQPLEITKVGGVMGRPIAVILLLLVLGAGVVFWIYRGPSPPVDQIAAAKQRVQQSIAISEAHRYVADAVRQIQETLAEIDRSVEAVAIAHADVARVEAAAV